MVNNRFNNILKDLGLEERESRSYIFSNFEGGVLSSPAIRKLAAGKRADAVRELGSYIKQYVASPEFKEKYQQAREERKPSTPGGDLDQLVKEQIKEMEMELPEGEKYLKQLPAGAPQRKMVEEELKKVRERLAILKDPKHPRYQAEALEMADIDEDQLKNYQEQLAWWNEHLPANPQLLIKKRLQEFLNLTADINFNAQLVKSGNKMKFADPKLEARSWDWKRCFRCGEETITAARVYTQQWLKELN